MVLAVLVGAPGKQALWLPPVLLLAGPVRWGGVAAAAGGAGEPRTDTPYTIACTDHRPC
eukprot:COSAG01_NODE_7640_length_3117_cov_99.838308_2_plen_59_part_00